MEAQLSYDKLLEAVKQLSPAALEDFQEQINHLKASQHSTSLSKKEADLLLKINRPSTRQGDIKYQELLVKRQNESLTEPEYQELIALSDRYEQENTERMKYLVQLASIRQVSLTKLMNQLEIPPSVYEWENSFYFSSKKTKLVRTFCVE